MTDSLQSKQIEMEAIMTIYKKINLLSAFIILLSAFPCFAEKIPVAASIFPVSDMVKKVGGDYVEVFSVIPPGASPHT
jgi:ABC-type Zn uptake system ZnuABC Zn-binding protein ZnuA